MLMFRPKGLPLVFSMPTQGTVLETPQQMDSHGNERRLHTRPRGSQLSDCDGRQEGQGGKFYRGGCDVLLALTDVGTTEVSRCKTLPASAAPCVYLR